MCKAQISQTLRRHLASTKTLGKNRRCEQNDKQNHCMEIKANELRLCQFEILLVFEH